MKQLANNWELYLNLISQDKKVTYSLITQVALRLISQGKRVVSGDVIEYVICEDGTSTAPTQRAYHPSEITERPG